MNIQLTVTGLATAKKVVASSMGVLLLTKKNTQKRIAEEGLAIIKNHIIRQDLPWKPLSEQYLQTKVNQGLSDKIYEATGEFIKGLRVRKDPSRDVYRIGAFTDVAHKPSGMSMGAIAKILEYGKEEIGIPARPLYRPSAVQLQRAIRNGRNKIKQDINKQVSILVKH